MKYRNVFSYVKMKRIYAFFCYETRNKEGIKELKELKERKSKFGWSINIIRVFFVNFLQDEGKAVVWGERGGPQQSFLRSMVVWIGFESLEVVFQKGFFLFLFSVLKRLV